MEKLINFFEIEYELKNDNYLNLDDNSNFTIDKSFEKIYIDGKSFIDLNEDFKTITVTDGDTNVELDFSNYKGNKKAFLNNNFKNKGKELLYDKIGRMSGVRLGFLMKNNGQTTHSINYIT